MWKQLFIVICFIALTACQRRERGMAPDPHAKPNIHPIYEIDPVQLNTTKNGKLYLAGNVSGTNVHLIHVYGTPYEMGYAIGTLLKEQLTNFISEMWAYIEEQGA